MSKVDGISSDRVTPLTPGTTGESRTGGRQPTTQPTPTQPTDGVDGARPTGPPVGTTPLEQRVIELERELARTRETRVEQEKAQKDAAKKPGFMRTVLEVFEFFGRFFTPFFNLISAFFRVLKIGYKLITGQKIDWKKEGLRLLGDIAGIFFPPAGAVINAGLNLWFNESQLLGGINEPFDYYQDPKTGKKIYVTKESGIRSTGKSIMGVGMNIFGGAKRLVTGGGSVKPSEGQTDFRPVRPATVPIG